MTLPGNSKNDQASALQRLRISAVATDIAEPPPAVWGLIGDGRDQFLKPTEVNDGLRKVAQGLHAVRSRL